MTREQKIDITLEELDREITIATYQEKRVRKCLAAAFIRIESETAAGGARTPFPLSVLNAEIEVDEKDTVAVLKELYGFYVTDVRYHEVDQGLPDSIMGGQLQSLIMRKMDKASQEEAENLLMDTIADYEQQGFVNGFRYATAIWKAC